MYKLLAKTLFIGKELHYMPTCHSTNDEARQKSTKADMNEGTVFITSVQTKGRGQRGNQWVSEPDKNLTLSLILKPNFLGATEHFYLNMVSSLAVKMCVEHFAPDVVVKVKWPNDILIGERKVAGILIENTLKGSRISSTIIGIGLNVNQTLFPGISATSLALTTGITFSLPIILEQLMLAMEHYYFMLKAQQYDQLKSEYLSHLLGFRVKRAFRAEHVFEAEVIDVRKTGQLILKTNKGEQAFDFKEIIWL